jgi:glycosyltransferase involved in cell wall biosynthesis
MILPETMASSSAGHPARAKDVERGKLRCLWLTRMDPVPTDAGDLMYSLHLLTSLSRAGVRLTVLAMRRMRDRAGTTDADGIEWIIVPWESDREVGKRAAVRSLFSHAPNVATQYNIAPFRRALRLQMARDWDAIVVDHLGMGWAWPAVQAYQRRKPGVLSVFVAHQCEAEVRRGMARNFCGNIVRKIALSIDAAKADRLEKRLVRQSNLVSAITDEDLRCFGSLAKIILLTPGYAGRHVACREISDATPRRTLILGSGNWLAKQMNLIEFTVAADELFHERQIELWVVGNVPNHLRKDHFRAIRFLGFVENLEPIFPSIRIGIVAERTGGGFKLKTLDYIYNRVPIAAIRGSIAGLPLTAGSHYLSFASMWELAQGVAVAIDNIELLNNLQETAYAECRARFDWADRGRALYNAMLQAPCRLQNREGRASKYA